MYLPIICLNLFSILICLFYQLYFYLAALILLVSVSIAFLIIIVYYFLYDVLSSLYKLDFCTIGQRKIVNYVARKTDKSTLEWDEIYKLVEIKFRDSYEKHVSIPDYSFWNSKFSYKVAPAG